MIRNLSVSHSHLPETAGLTTNPCTTSPTERAQTAPAKILIVLYFSLKSIATAFSCWWGLISSMGSLSSGTNECVDALQPGTRSTNEVKLCEFVWQSITNKRVSVMPFSDAGYLTVPVLARRIMS